MVRLAGLTRGFEFGSCMLVCCFLVVASAGAARGGNCARMPALGPGELVGAVNALAKADVPIDVAASAPCGIDRLPNSRAALMPLVPAEHRRLIEACARGRLRLQRRTAGLDLFALIDEPADMPECAVTVRTFFSGRTVDVATGAGLSDGPYPIRFDWAVVLDPESGTLFSFVFNCRD